MGWRLSFLSMGVIKIPKATLFQQYVDYLEAEQYCASTINTYTGQLMRYFRWLHSRDMRRGFRIERDSVLVFKTYLLEQQETKPATVNAYLSALLKYNEFLIEANVQCETVIRAKDYMKMQAELSNPWDGEDEDVDTLIRSVRESGKRFAVRDYSMIIVMAYAGLRVSETTSLDIDDVLLSDLELYVRNGKGQKSRKVYMSQKIVTAIESYLQIRPETECKALFISKSGGRMTRRRVHQVIAEHSDTLSPHKLRHYFCSQSQSVAGYSIIETANQAGHSSPVTTMRYSHPRKKDILQKANRM